MFNKPSLAFLSSLTTDFTPVIKGFAHQTYIPLDLSIHQNLLSTSVLFNPVQMQERLTQWLHKNQAEVAFGGYMELRKIYDRSMHFLTDEAQKRNLHLGVDFWAAAETPVVAPIAGRVHSLANNEGYGNYGPTLLLEHQISGHQFFSLYGHLSLASLSLLQQGDLVKAGDTIGFLGDARVNGDYAPHLHFQLILDIENYVGDYPGVARALEKPYYLKNCPDPNILLKYKSA
ncbi:peptidoglycan DD-metalloendopeptidase family protein [Mesonia sp. HuA40]|uniref:peptidoglycan DD-metalloendopeptidase family protein n=1 Tax=Mesonia sp. HuA40 TaxID=2602761 RepID=UPI0011CCDEAA|nr:peptidoglycan DD-metalloendopeptidase family protein [Mesonia sp. HuA40]TXK73529.1 peptidoglycan DD-metalloendopeptidase family protein [Mesonia sp. HuA40]